MVGAHGPPQLLRAPALGLCDWLLRPALSGAGATADGDQLVALPAPLRLLAGRAQLGDARLVPVRDSPQPAHRCGEPSHGRFDHGRVDDLLEEPALGLAAPRSAWRHPFRIAFLNLRSAFHKAVAESPLRARAAGHDAARVACLRAHRTLHSSHLAWEATPHRQRQARVGFFGARLAVQAGDRRHGAELLRVARGCSGADRLGVAAVQAAAGAAPADVGRQIRLLLADAGRARRSGHLGRPLV
mmetsp:Transcript_15824/g.40342  ORF Transcript_15824/g.40342 Transcript_15824/m.40342 type:complete len:243 (+) Transcript_15824:226-954(+)